MNLNELSTSFVTTSSAVKENSKKANPYDNSDKNKDQSFSLLLSQLLESNNKYKYTAPVSSVSANSAVSTATQAVDAVSAAASSSGVNISA